MRRRLDGRASRVFQVDLAPGVKVDMPANALATTCCHCLRTANTEPDFDKNVARQSSEGPSITFT